MIKAILATGKSGQMGLNNALPWHDPADLRRFKQVTAGGILVAGHHTYKSMAHLLDKYGYMSLNRILMMDARTRPVIEQIRYLNHMYPETPVFVIGGAKTLDRWAPYVGHWDITKIDYDGPADTWFNPAWLQVGEQQWKPQ